MLTGLFHMKQRGERGDQWRRRNNGTGSQTREKRKQSEDEAKEMMRKGSGESLWESELHKVLHWLAPKRGAQPRARLLLPLFCF